MADSATGSSAAPSLSRDDVLRLAHLARLELTDDEILRFTDQLSSILAYIEQLNAVPVTLQAPQDWVSRSNPASTANRHSSSEVHPLSLSPEAALENAPQTIQGLITVPSVAAVDRAASGPDPMPEADAVPDAGDVTP